jgi:hypothetical protein
MEEEFSFENAYRQVAWELCVEAAALATTNLEIFVYEDSDNSHKATRVRTLEAASVKLVASNLGGIRIHGTWKAGGKSGKLDVIDVHLSPTATETFLVRFVEEAIRLQIAKKLYGMGSSPVDSVDGSE